MQIVDYEPTPGPALYLAEEAEVRRRRLELGDRLTFPLGDRHCAGRIVDDRHRPCTAPGTPWCDAHTDTWICARCRGTCLKDEMDCHVQHDIYLAAFPPDVFKVGVTRTGRLDERLAEQGAAEGARIDRVENGRIAREIEADLATDLTDRVAVSTKLAGLTRSIDRARWDALREEYAPAERTVPNYALELAAPPVPETIARGEVVGLVGRLLCLEWRGTTFGTDLRSLVGHEVTDESADRQLQSGLGAYG